MVGIRHPKWDERPLLIVMLKKQEEEEEGSAAAALSKEELLAFFKGKVASWWVPDDVAFVEAIPLGPTGKVLKTELRESLLKGRGSRGDRGG